MRPDSLTAEEDEGGRMSAPHGNWKRLGPSDRGKFCCCWQSRDGKQTCVLDATHVCNVHDFQGRWCGEAMCAKHVPRPKHAKPRLGGKKLRRQGKQRGVCFSGFGCVRPLGHRGACRDALGVVHPDGRSTPWSRTPLRPVEFLRASSPAAASSGPSKRRRSGASGCHDAGNLTPGAESGKAESTSSCAIRYELDREAVLPALSAAVGTQLPLTAHLQFGGREWLQDFDEHGRLIVTVTR